MSNAHTTRGRNPSLQLNALDAEKSEVFPKSNSTHYPEEQNFSANDAIEDLCRNSNTPPFQKNAAPTVIILFPQTQYNAPSAQIISMDKKKRKDHLYVLHAAQFMPISHIIALIVDDQSNPNPSTLKNHGDGNPGKSSAPVSP